MDTIKLNPGPEEGKAPVAQALAGKLRIQPATNSLGVLSDLLYPEGCVKTYLACDLPAPVAAKLRRAWNSHDALVSAVAQAQYEIDSWNGESYGCAETAGELATRLIHILTNQTFLAQVNEAKAGA